MRDLFCLRSCNKEYCNRYEHGRIPCTCHYCSGRKYRFIDKGSRRKEWMELPIQILYWFGIEPMHYCYCLRDWYGKIIVLLLRLLLKNSTTKIKNFDNPLPLRTPAWYIFNHTASLVATVFTTHSETVTYIFWFVTTRCNATQRP